jgi:hypothetical protein
MALERELEYGREYPREAHSHGQQDRKEHEEHR